MRRRCGGLVACDELLAARQAREGLALLPTHSRVNPLPTESASPSAVSDTGQREGEPSVPVVTAGRLPAATGLQPPGDPSPWGRSSVRERLWRRRLQAPSQTMPTVRDRVATAAARGAATAIKATGSGRGSTLPGKVANLISASFLHDRAAELPEGFVLVTGTNGKTTTAAMAAHVLRARGRSLVHNVEGANLLSGIASAFAAQGRASLALLEADEAIVPRAVAALGTPRVVVLTNLFRDQLDRYGEVDRLAEGWLDALRRARGHRAGRQRRRPARGPRRPLVGSRDAVLTASNPARRRRRSRTARSATPSSARPAASSSSTAPAGCRSSETTAAGAATSRVPRATSRRAICSSPRPR